MFCVAEGNQSDIRLIDQSARLQRRERAVDQREKGGPMRQMAPKRCDPRIDTGRTKGIHTTNDIPGIGRDRLTR